MRQLLKLAFYANGLFLSLLVPAFLYLRMTGIVNTKGYDWVIGVGLVVITFFSLAGMALMYKTWED